jgi:hypothetical protein
MSIYWVSPTGSDITGDGSYESPYATIETAMVRFTDGDQIRLKAGTYTPVDSLVFSGVSGSIFSEDPRGAIIVPQQTTLSNAAIDVSGSDRFDVVGVIVHQATNAYNNLGGISLRNVTMGHVYACTVSDFTVTGGEFVGIEMLGGGRVEGCIIEDVVTSIPTYGIAVTGCDVIDCTVQNVSGTSSVIPIDINGGITSFSGFDDVDSIDLSPGKMISVSGLEPVKNQDVFFTTMKFDDISDHQAYFSLAIPMPLLISTTRTLSILSIPWGGGPMVVDVTINCLDESGNVVCSGYREVTITIPVGTYQVTSVDISDCIVQSASFIHIDIQRNAPANPADVGGDWYYCGGGIY